MSDSGLALPTTHEADMRPLIAAKIRTFDAWWNFPTPPETAPLEERIEAEQVKATLFRQWREADEALFKARSAV